MPAAAKGRIEHEHTREAIRRRLESGPRPSYARDFVYGGIDGAVTTFAAVSGVVGADLSPLYVVIIGLANVLGDGFSMAAGIYSATRAEEISCFSTLPPATSTATARQMSAMRRSRLRTPASRV